MCVMLCVWGDNIHTYIHTHHTHNPIIHTYRHMQGLIYTDADHISGTPPHMSSHTSSTSTTPIFSSRYSPECARPSKARLASRCNDLNSAACSLRATVRFIGGVARESSDVKTQQSVR